ncbi:hypothetical protein ES703_51607 [subsurface metagenome]
MKKKFTKILGVGLTLALLCSLLLTAAPVSAISVPTVVPSSATISATTSYAVTFNLGKELVSTASELIDVDSGGGTATWSTEEAHSGSYSAKLTSVADGTAYAVPYAVRVAYGEALDTIDVDDFTYWYSKTVSPGSFGVLYIDKEGGDTVDQALISSVAATNITTGAWTETAQYDYWHEYRCLGNSKDVVVDQPSGTWKTLADWQAAYPDATLVYVAAGWGTVADVTIYIDDITINNSVYALEETPAVNTITIVFPPTTVVPDGVLAGTIQASPGWIRGQWANATTTGVTFEGVALTRTVTATFSASDKIGEGATVRIQIPGIKNPPAIGSYNLTVKTSAETTAVTSAAYAVGAPAILPLPGVVERYNTAGVLMARTNSIQAAITASSAGDSINVGAGTYDEVIDVSKSVTITGDAATTIIKDTDGLGTGGTVTISYVPTATTVAGAVFDGFTVMGRPGVDALTITGSNVTVQNCIFTKAGTATTALAQDMIYYNPTLLPTLASTITNCTFDTTLGIVVDNGVRIAASAKAIGLTVSSCTFTVDGAIDLEDSAVNTAGVGTTLLPITISGNTITGVSGIGVTFTGAGVATASDNTLTGLNQAFKIVAGTATIKGNTIDNCGLVISTTAAVGKAAIGVTATTALSITNNTITNCPNDIIEITLGADSSKVNMMFNNLTDNTKGIDNDDTTTAHIFNATHNWWGAATGPATGFNVTAGAVNDTTAYLGSEATGSFALDSASLITKTTVGVDVIATGTVAPAIIGVANYAANPQDATPLPAIAGGFYDVYLADAATSLTTSVLIKFYNANVTANTKVYIWGTIAGGWQLVTPATAQGVNLYGGFAYATVDPANLTGTPFALVGGAAAALGTPTLEAPDPSADDIRLTPGFAWTAVDDADAYYFELADNSGFVAPLVKRIVSFESYAYMTELDYSSAYYWRVKAVSGLDIEDIQEGDWASGVFITMDEPEEVPPVIVQEQPPVIIEPIVEVITPPATEITPAWIYVIIGVGAVLVIALLVLIVRTRRVA